MKNSFWFYFALGAIFNIVFVFFTLESTYDALIHLFFGNHYAKDWFNPWEDRWYTGFNVMTYPPLVHQMIALFSFIIPLKGALLATSIIVILLFISGVYQFSHTITANRKASEYAMLFASFSTIFIETLHIFGQLPTLMGMAMLLHSYPFINSFLRKGKLQDLLLTLSFLLAAVSSHHVTPIFGMVFFIAPIMGKAIMDRAHSLKMSQKSSYVDYPDKVYNSITVKEFINSFKALFFKIITLGISLVLVIVLGILPYWISSKNDPISQVPIPHGSRVSFFESFSSGLMFFLIPWGLSLLFLPYIFYKTWLKKNIFFGISFTLLFILGTGGTTSIPKFLLGDTAFNILTFDRFTFWAAMISFPFIGKGIQDIVEGKYKVYVHSSFQKKISKLAVLILIFVGVFFVAFTTALSTFKNLQPKKIDPAPIVNFLHQDQHDHWRYLTFGLGDQMAYLSALTNAKMIDGNYHSARKLPELTTKAVERLENSKFNGVEGLGSLQQILTNSNKYHLKFIFSNDKFYDPLLFFYGWEKLVQLENGIWVWQKNGVKPLPVFKNTKSFPTWMSLQWGIVPLLSIILIIVLLSIFKKPFFQPNEFSSIRYRNKMDKKYFEFIHIWIFAVFFMLIGIFVYQWNKKFNYYSPENSVKGYYHALDIKQFEKAFERIVPNHYSNMDEFMQQFLTSDGLLNSYGKMENIAVETIEENDTEAWLKVHSHWVTPLKNIDKQDTVYLKKIKNRWYVSPKKYEYTIPQDLLISSSQADFYASGKRKVNMKKNLHEDVINSPQIQFVSAKLIQHDDEYSVIGELYNADHFPTYINVSAELYDEDHQLIASYTVQDLMNHHLMPKESTPFKIDFQTIAWLNKDILKDPTFDPQFIEKFKFQSEPKYVVVHCTSVFSTEPIYNKIQQYFQSDKNDAYELNVYNAGTKEVTITNYLTSYYNEKNELIWLSNYYSEEAIKPQRKAFVTIPLEKKKNIKVVKDVLDNCYINGSPAHTATVENLAKSATNNQRMYRTSMVNFVGNE